MASVKFGIGIVGVVVVAFANVATTWAQSDELPWLRERNGGSLGGGRSLSTAPPFDVEVKVTASGEAPYYFGDAVAISGDTTIVASWFNVYFYERDEGGPDNWGELANIYVLEGGFGSSVAISGDTAIVGATSAHGNVDYSGVVYVYQRNEGGLGNWGEVARLSASDAEAHADFGRSVAISGDTAIVGAPRDNNGYGSAYVFHRDEGGADNWGEVAKVGRITHRGDFGLSVAISGDTAIAGVTGDNELGIFSGAAYVYRRDAGGFDNWGEVAKVTASDGEAFDGFGWKVAISYDVAIVGATWGADDGKAYVYQQDEGGVDNWGEMAKLTPSDGAPQVNFAMSVAINGDTAMVGSTGSSSFGAAYVYGRDAGGANNWGEVDKLTASDGNYGANFGSAVGINGDTAIVGDSYAGAAYLYVSCSRDDQCDDVAVCNGVETCDIETGACVADVPIECDDGDDCNGIESCDPKTGDCLDSKIVGCNGNGFNTDLKIAASDLMIDDYFGASVAISGDTAIVGARYDDDNGTNSGSAYVYSRDRGGTDNWGQVAKITASDGVAIDYFGYSVAICGNTAIVGAWYDDDDGINPGSAYVYSRDQGGIDNWGTGGQDYCK